MKENTHDRVIKAAVKVMSEVGYHGMSIGILAKLVGVSKSTAVHYFKTKEGILLAVLENFLSYYLAEFKPILHDKQMDGIEKLHKYINFHMNMIAEQRDVLIINLSDTKYLSGSNKEIYQNQQRQYQQQLVKIILQIQYENTGLFEGLDPLVTAKGIMGMCNHACVWFKKDDPFSIEDIATQFFMILTEGHDLKVPGLKSMSVGVQNAQKSGSTH